MRPSPAAGRRILATLALLAALTVVGCGKKGPPLPPLPQGPLPASQVQARQLGDRALVGFDVPEPRGPKPRQVPVRAELVRVVFPPGVAPAPDPDAFRRRGVVVGRTANQRLESGSRVRLEDGQLEDLERRGLGSTLRYAVRIRDGKGRSSLLAVAEDLIPLDTISQPEALRAEPTAGGVRLRWEPSADAPAETGYNVYRWRPEGSWPMRPLNASPVTLPEYLDGTVSIGQRYVYEVRAVLESGTPFRESAGSEQREIVAEDRFAPGPPQGLVGVQEGDKVRLFWDPNSERDVAGYRVYRSLDETSWELVGAGTIEQLSFVDENVEVGQRLSYRVTALDRAEPANESGPSEVYTLEVVAEPVQPGSDDGGASP